MEIDRRILPILPTSPTVEGMRFWMIERRQQRLQTAATNDRRQLYVERVAILSGLAAGLRSTDPEVRGRTPRG